MFIQDSHGDSFPALCDKHNFRLYAHLSVTMRHLCEYTGGSCVCHRELGINTWHLDEHADRRCACHRELGINMWHLGEHTGGSCVWHMGLENVTLRWAYRRKLCLSHRAGNESPCASTTSVCMLIQVSRVDPQLPVTNTASACIFT
jgi:hypothetical protein